MYKSCLLLLFEVADVTKLHVQNAWVRERALQSLKWPQGASQAPPAVDDHLPRSWATICDEKIPR